MTQEVIHGVSKHRYYKRWNDMIQRCYNPLDVGYEKYGAVGVSVVPEWDRRNPKGAFNYVVWIEQQVATLPADKQELPFLVSRKNKALPYSPENCCIVNATESSQNRSTVILNFELVADLRRFKRHYKEITLREMCTIFGIKHIYTLSRCLQGISWPNVNDVEPPLIILRATCGRRSKERLFQ